MSRTLFGLCLVSLFAVAGEASAQSGRPLLRGRFYTPPQSGVTNAMYSPAYQMPMQMPMAGMPMPMTGTSPSGVITAGATVPASPSQTQGMSGGTMPSMQQPMYDRNGRIVGWQSGPMQQFQGNMITPVGTSIPGDPTITQSGNQTGRRPGTRPLGRLFGRNRM
jgi:hypothetical protein